MIARIDLGVSNPSRSIALYRDSTLLVVTSLGLSVFDVGNLLRPVKRFELFFY